MENYQHLELQHGLESFSTREAISLTSQKRLRQAMNSIDLCVNLELYKCKIRLCFAKWTEGRTLSTEPEFVRDEEDIDPGGSNQGSRNEVIAISKQSIRRRKTDMKGKGRSFTMLVSNQNQRVKFVQFLSRFGDGRNREFSS